MLTYLDELAKDAPESWTLCEESPANSGGSGDSSFDPHQVDELCFQGEAQSAHPTIIVPTRRPLGKGLIDEGG